jgi:hypothetical protein
MSLGSAIYGSANFFDALIHQHVPLRHDRLSSRLMNNLLSSVPS